MNFTKMQKPHPGLQQCNSSWQPIASNQCKIKAICYTSNRPNSSRSMHKQSLITCCQLPKHNRTHQEDWNQFLAPSAVVPPIHVAKRGSCAADIIEVLFANQITNQYGMTYGRAKISAGSKCTAFSHTCGVSPASEDFTTGSLSCEILLSNNHSWPSKSDHSTLGTEYMRLRYLVSGWGGFEDASINGTTGTVAVGVLFEGTASGWASMKPFILHSLFSILALLVAIPGLSEAFGMEIWQASNILPFSVRGWEEDGLGNLLGQFSLAVRKFKN